MYFGLRFSGLRRSLSKHVLGNNDEYVGGGGDLYSIIFTSEQIHEKLGMRRVFSGARNRESYMVKSPEMNV
jgi:hypothetical protein